MKGILFFLGSIFRWPVQNSKEFLILHVYLLGIYGITFLLRNIGLELSNLIFTVGLIAPIGYLIYNGLPLDCLNYKSAIKRELSSINLIKKLIRKLIYKTCITSLTSGIISLNFLSIPIFKVIVLLGQLPQAP